MKKELTTQELKKDAVDLAATISKKKKALQALKDCGANTDTLEKEIVESEEVYGLLTEKIEEQKANEKAEKFGEGHDEALEKALKVYEGYEGNEPLSFVRGLKPSYFYNYITISKNPKTETETLKLDTQYFPDVKLKSHRPILTTEKSREYLALLIAGEPIPDPFGGEPTIRPSRTYEAIGGTLNNPDPRIYNLLDTSGRLLPTGKKVTSCPLPLRALLMSVSGNSRKLVNGEYVYSKRENMEWLEKWIYGALHANLGNPLTTMPVLFGVGKTGKNALFDRVFPGILGPKLCLTTTWDVMSGDFNSIRKGKIFVFIDEVPDREDWSKLKNQTGSPTIVIKEKFMPEYEIENTIMYAIGSNEMVYPLPFESGDQMRRVSPIEATSKSLFATNIVELLGEERVRTELENNKVSTDGKDLFELGHAWLSHFPEKWYSKEILQDFLDYLNTKFCDETYDLQPLRGADWNKIAEAKQTLTERVRDFVREWSPRYITSEALWSIGQVFDEWSGRFAQKRASFANKMITEMESLGYSRESRVMIGDRRLTVYYKDRAVLDKLTLDVGKYINQAYVDGKFVNELIYPNSTPKKVVPIKKVASGTTGFEDL